jgi:hypothetical protein
VKATHLYFIPQQPDWMHRPGVGCLTSFASHLTFYFLRSQNTPQSPGSAVGTYSKYWQEVISSTQSLTN